MDIIKPDYDEKRYQILYPEKSSLDIFLHKKKIHKDPKNICRIINGEVVFNVPYQKPKKIII